MSVVVFTSKSRETPLPRSGFIKTSNNFDKQSKQRDRAHNVDVC
jgi:hypothetical protein